MENEEAIIILGGLPIWDIDLDTARRLAKDYSDKGGTPIVIYNGKRIIL